MIAAYRRNQCVVLTMLGALIGATMAELKHNAALWWVSALLVPIYLVPAAWQDRRNERRLTLRRIVEKCSACGTVTAYPRTGGNAGMCAHAVRRDDCRICW